MNDSGSAEVSRLRLEVVDESPPEAGVLAQILASSIRASVEDSDVTLARVEASAQDLGTILFAVVHAHTLFSLAHAISSFLGQYPRVVVRYSRPDGTNVEVFNAERKDVLDILRVLERS
jgi:hypothetical protein